MRKNAIFRRKLKSALIAALPLTPAALVNTITENYPLNAAHTVVGRKDVVLAREEDFYFCDSDPDILTFLVSLNSG